MQSGLRLRIDRIAKKLRACAHRLSLLQLGRARSVVQAGLAPISSSIVVASVQQQQQDDEEAAGGPLEGLASLATCPEVPRQAWAPQLAARTRYPTTRAYRSDRQMPG